jgi:hypothetical protein
MKIPVYLLTLDVSAFNHRLASLHPFLRYKSIANIVRLRSILFLDTQLAAIILRLWLSSSLNRRHVAGQVHFACQDKFKMELCQPFRLRPISHIDFNNITTSTILSLLLLLTSPI